MTISLILGVLGISGQLMLMRNARIGWTLSLVAQPVWVVFALVTGQYGLLLLTPGYALAAALNLRRAIHVHRATALASSSPAGEGAAS